MGCGCGQIPCRCLTPTAISGCGTFPGNCDSVQNRSVPYYVAATPIEESHCQEIRTEKFSSAVCSQLSWVIPNCNETATIVLLDVVYVPVGSYIWNSAYGYFLVQSFDKVTGELVIENTCIVGNASPGTTIPICTCFIVSPPPCPSALGDVVYLAADFTAPNNGDCVNIQVTGISGLVEGTIIGLSTGNYRLDTIISINEITICNEGDGIAGGTLVVALDGGGNYQYPITTVLGNVLAQDIPAPVSGTVSGGSITLSITGTVVIINPSITKQMLVFLTVEGWSNGEVTDANTNIFSMEYVLNETINGGAPSTVVFQENSFFPPSDAAAVYSENINYTGGYTVLPGATLTVDMEFLLTFTGTASAAYAVSDLNIELNAIGVIG